MEVFQMEIAGAVGRIVPMFSCTKAFFQRYLTEKAPDFTAAVTQEDIAFEQDVLLKEAIREGLRPRRFTDQFLERAAIQRCFAEFLFRQDTLLLHGSTVAVDGQAYLFTAKCGTGKSTHTRIWRERFGSRAVMVNDDKPFLRLTAEGVFACGSPWSGKHGLDSNVCLPLRGICLLERGAENHIAPADPAALLPFLQEQCFCPADPQQKQRFLRLLQSLCQSVPLWHMQCTREPEAAETAYRAMQA